MQHRRLGKSAIYVSDICMGTMTFGNQADEAMAHRILDMSFEAGIDFYDTAEGYPVPPDAKYVGLTEEIVGRWMKTKSRDAIIMATKVSGPSHTWFKSPKRSGMTALDRRNIIVEGQDLNALIGREFDVQGVRFLGTEEASPCLWMDEAFGKGALQALVGKGGLRAKILQSGKLRKES